MSYKPDWNIKLFIRILIFNISKHKAGAVSQILNVADKESSKKSKATDLTVKKGKTSKKSNTMSETMWMKEGQSQFGKNYSS